MKRVHRMVLVVALFAFIGILFPSAIMAADPIIVGVPTSLGQPSGAEALNSVVMAVEEINAQGGINVGGSKRIVKVESMDIRDASPGVPVPDALLGLEKIILDKKWTPSWWALSAQRPSWPVWTSLQSTKSPCWAPLP